MGAVRWYTYCMDTHPVTWYPAGLVASAAHHGITLTHQQCVLWVSAFKALHPTWAYTFDVGAAQPGWIALHWRDQSGRSHLTVHPLFA